MPIERYGNDDAAERLRRIVGPFILRRLKSDPTIIQDLPPKNEMKVVCTLTREQATLYKAVVNEELRRIESSDGIERRGRVLALLMFTKQICNAARDRGAPERAARRLRAARTWPHLCTRWQNARLRRPGGKVTARVTGSRATRDEITIELTELSASAWKKAIGGLAKTAQFSAELLAGQMPQAIDEVFVEAGVSLFPKQRADLKTSCSCPDWGDPCKHVAATHYVLGEALDRDPFLLFELRGRTKSQVLDALRVARGGGDEPPAKKAREQATIEVPTMKLGKLKAAEDDKPREPLPTLHFSFDEPVTHGAVLRQLGAPAAWQGDASPADVLARPSCGQPRRRRAASR